jgi:hypothetical protein
VEFLLALISLLCLAAASCAGMASQGQVVDALLVKKLFVKEIQARSHSSFFKIANQNAC